MQIPVFGADNPRENTDRSRQKISAEYNDCSSARPINPADPHSFSTSGATLME
jgi:hypothetical protein